MMTNTTSTAAVEDALNRIGRMVMTQIAIAQQHETPVDHMSVECAMCDTHLLHLRELVRTELKAAREEGRAAGRRDATVREAAEIILTRIESAHIDDWKENDVDWFAIERLKAALATPTETKPTTATTEAQ